MRDAVCNSVVYQMSKFGYPLAITSLSSTAGFPIRLVEMVTIYLPCAEVCFYRHLGSRIAAFLYVPWSGQALLTLSEHVHEYISPSDPARGNYLATALKTVRAPDPVHCFPTFQVSNSCTSRNSGRWEATNTVLLFEDGDLECTRTGALNPSHTAHQMSLPVFLPGPLLNRMFVTWGK